MYILFVSYKKKKKEQRGGRLGVIGGNVVVLIKRKQKSEVYRSYLSCIVYVPYINVFKNKSRSSVEVDLASSVATSSCEHTIHIYIYIYR